MPDQTPRKAYRTETPNLVDDWGLDPYSYRLYGHYRRWCGEHGTYNRPLRETAKLTGISPAQVCRARQKLLDQELIEMEPDGSVRVADIWDLNRAWFVSRRNRSVSVRNRSVSVRNRSVSDRNRSVSVRNNLFLSETSPYKNLLEGTSERTLEDTTTTESAGGGGGGAHPRSTAPAQAPEQPLSSFTLEQVEVWAETLPGIVAPDRFARARWLDGLADRRIAAFYARREAPPPPIAVEAPQPLAIERLPPDVEADAVRMFADFLDEGRTPESLDQQFAPGIAPEQWVGMRSAALEEFQRRRSRLVNPDPQRPEERI